MIVLLDLISDIPVYYCLFFAVVGMYRRSLLTFLYYFENRMTEYLLHVIMDQTICFNFKADLNSVLISTWMYETMIWLKH